MTDFTWTPSDDAQAALAGYGANEPMFTVLAFLDGLQSGLAAEELAVTVTPESIDAWGTFAETRAALEAIGDWGIGTYPSPAESAADVVYVKVLEGVTEAYQQVERIEIVPAAWITLVWRPEVAMWLVHGIGRPIAPSDIPRTSPGIAPAYTRAAE